MDRKYQHGARRGYLLHYVTSETDGATPVRQRRHDADCACPEYTCRRVNAVGGKMQMQIDVTLTQADTQTYHVYVELRNDRGCNASLLRQLQRAPVVIPPPITGQ